MERLTNILDKQFLWQAEEACFRLSQARRPKLFEHYKFEWSFDFIHNQMMGYVFEYVRFEEIAFQDGSRLIKHWGSSRIFAQNPKRDIYILSVDL